MLCPDRQGRRRRRIKEGGREGGQYSSPEGGRVLQFLQAVRIAVIFAPLPKVAWDYVSRAAGRLVVLAAAVPDLVPTATSRGKSHFFVGRSRGYNAEKKAVGSGDESRVEGGGETRKGAKGGEGKEEKRSHRPLDVRLNICFIRLRPLGHTCVYCCKCKWRLKIL